jgi:FKBP-type peptidyl-prolyl cis-trans isomerase
MIKFFFLSLCVLLISSCEIEGVSSESEKESESNVNLEEDTSGSELSLTDSLKSRSKEVVEEDTLDVLTMDNGLKITWYKKGKGDLLKKGDVVNIDYRNKLEDGTVYDGNHLIKKKYIPFLVGWNQQTPGWDIAMKKLRVGDDVDIFIPSELARGELGIEGIVPPNANNILSLRVLSKPEPTKVVDGIKIWKVDELKNPGDSVDFKDKVLMDYWVSSESTPRYDNSYKRRQPFELVMGDGNIVPGLYKALHFAREGDKMMILIPSREAYGKKGLTDRIKPNEDIFYDIIVRDVTKMD